MNESQKSRLGKLCNVCGSKGRVEVIAACSGCDRAHEHIYCMQKLHISVPENWCCESCRSRNIKDKCAKKVKIEKTITSPKEEILKLNDEGNPMPVKSDKKQLNGKRKTVCSDGLSTMIPNVGKKQDVLVQVSLPSNRPVSVRLATKDAAKKCETSPALRSLPAKSEGNCMLGNSDDMSLSVIRKPLPNFDHSTKFLGLGKNESVPVPSKQVSNLLSRGNSSKSVENSKVKFLPAEEAALLPSGTKVKACTPRASLGNVPSVAKRTSSGVPASEASKACLQKGKSNSIFGPPPVYNKPITHEGTRLGTSTQCSPVTAQSHIERPPSRVCKPFTSARLMGVDDKLFIPQLGAVRPVPGTRKALFQLNGGSLEREAYCSPSKDAECLKATFSPLRNGNLMKGMKNSPDGTSFADVQLKNSDGQEGVSSLMLSGITEGKVQNHLDQDALWKGSFEIHDSVCCSDFYDGIEAHRPIIVSHKVCEVSKQMPNKLQFKLHPRLDIWPRIFRKECPTANDVALYFLPGDSSKKKYFYLLELIEIADLAMRTYLGGVELLIFTSKQLREDCQKLNMQLFLWGIFRRVKDPKVSDLEGGSSYIPAADSDNAEEVDMEIDMIAGKDVGRQDKPVLRPVAFGSGKSSEFPLRLNGHKVSCPQHVSSNAESSLRCKKVRFCTDTSPSDLEKTTNSNVLDGTPNVPFGTCKEEEIERSAASMPRSTLHANRSPLRFIGSRHAGGRHHGPCGESVRAPPSIRVNRLEVADASIPDVPSGFSKSSASVAAREKSFVGRHLHGPCDESVRALPSVKANRLEVADDSIPDVPPGFSKSSASVAAREKSLLKSNLEKPTIQKVVDGPAHFSKPVNLKHEFHSSVAGYKKEKATTGATSFPNSSSMPFARDVDISPGFLRKLDSSEAIRKNEKEEHRSFDTTSGKDECQSSKVMVERDRDIYPSSCATRGLDIAPGFLKKPECENHSSKAMLKRVKDEHHSSEAAGSMGVSSIVLNQLDYENQSSKSACRKDKDECLLSEVSSEKVKDMRPFGALSEGEEDEYNSAESTVCNTKSIVGITEVGNSLEDAGDIECASSEGSIQGSGLLAQKYITAAESLQVPLMCHQAAFLESHIRTDSAGDSSVGTPAHMGSQFLFGSSSCLQLFPLEVESTTQEIQVVGTDNDLVLGNARRAKDSCPVNGEESLALSLSRPQYLKNGNNWITVLSKERLQQDGCGEELQLTL